MIVSRSGVPSVADVCDGLALLREVALGQSIGVPIEMSIVIDEPAVGAQLIDRCTAALAMEKFNDTTVCGRQHRRSLRRRNIDGVVDSAFRPGFGKSVAQLIGAHTCNRNNQFSGRRRYARSILRIIQ